eukprot:7019670-Prymnesium_polylepis.2
MKPRGACSPGANTRGLRQRARCTMNCGSAPSSDQSRFSHFEDNAQVTSPCNAGDIRSSSLRCANAR